MVVLLILAILLAIAIPTFLGVTKSANDRAAQSNLNTALVNAKAYYQNNSQTYTDHCSLRHGSGPGRASPDLPVDGFHRQNQISCSSPSATAGTGTGIILAAVSKNGRTAGIAVDNTDGNRQSTDVAAVEPPTATPPTPALLAPSTVSQNECSQLHCVDDRGQSAPDTPPSRATDSLRRRSLIQTAQGVLPSRAGRVSVERECPLFPGRGHSHVLTRVGGESLKPGRRSSRWSEANRSVRQPPDVSGAVPPIGETSIAVDSDADRRSDDDRS